MLQLFNVGGMVNISVSDATFMLYVVDEYNIVHVQSKKVKIIPPLNIKNGAVYTAVIAGTIDETEEDNKYSSVHHFIDEGETARRDTAHIEKRIDLASMINNLLSKIDRPKQARAA
jgi:hypothetical protein